MIGSPKHCEYCEGKVLHAACTYTMAVELHEFAAAQVELLAAAARLWRPNANSVSSRKLFSSLSQYGHLALSANHRRNGEAAVRVAVNVAAALALAYPAAAAQSLLREQTRAGHLRCARFAATRFDFLF